MYFPKAIEDVCYEADHIEQVLSAVKATFPAYFARYVETRGGVQKTAEDIAKLAEHFGTASKPKANKTDAKLSLSETFQKAVSEFESDRDKYLDLLHPETLSEYSDDPPSFKTRALKNDCPIIRKTLNNRRAKQLDKYRKSFNLADPNQLLQVVRNISDFAHRYVEAYDEDSHASARGPNDFGMDELDEDDYWLTGVIGGGIRSHFLYKFEPQVFSNRSQDAVWALWYLTEKKKFGCHQDSEFLMIRVEQNIIAQNYFYPYDLFTYYALQLWELLREQYRTHDVPLPAKLRYVAVDSFLTYVARLHDDEIADLKAQVTDEHYAA